MIRKNNSLLSALIIISCLKIDFCIGSVDLNDAHSTTDTYKPILSQSSYSKENIMPNFPVITHVKDTVKSINLFEDIDEKQLDDAYKSNLVEYLQWSKLNKKIEANEPVCKNLISIVKKFYDLCKQDHVNSINTFASILSTYYPDEALKWYIHAYQISLVKNDTINNNSLRGIKNLLENNSISDKITDCIDYIMYNYKIDRLSYLQYGQELLYDHINFYNKIDKRLINIYMFKFLFKNVQNLNVEQNVINRAKYHYARLYFEIGAELMDVKNSEINSETLFKFSKDLFLDSNFSYSSTYLAIIYQRNLDRSDLSPKDSLKKAWDTYNRMLVWPTADKAEASQLPIIGLTAMLEMFESSREVRKAVGNNIYQNHAKLLFDLYQSRKSPHDLYFSALMLLDLAKLNDMPLDERLDKANEFYNQCKDKISNAEKFTYNALLGKLHSEGVFQKKKTQQNKIEYLSVSNDYLHEALIYKKDINEQKVKNVSNLIEKNRSALISLKKAINSQDPNNNITQRSSKNEDTDVENTTIEKIANFDPSLHLHSSNKPSKYKDETTDINSLVHKEKKPVSCTIDSAINLAIDHTVDDNQSSIKKVYKIVFANKAIEAEYHEMNSTYKSKLSELETDLQFNPRSGQGRPEPLKGGLKNFWSRRITGKDRLVYIINDTEKQVTVYAYKSHYESMKNLSNIN